MIPYLTTMSENNKESVQRGYEDTFDFWEQSKLKKLLPEVLFS